jgi:hypothetical protein
VFYPTGYSMLEEKPLPEDLVVHGAPYLGPSIVTMYDCDFSDQIRHKNRL